MCDDPILLCGIRPKTSQYCNRAEACVYWVKLDDLVKLIPREGYLFVLVGAGARTGMERGEGERAVITAWSMRI